MSHQKIKTIQQQFTLGSRTWFQAKAQAKAQAEALGLTVSEYVSLLVDEDNNPTKRLKKVLTFLAPLTSKAEARYNREIKEFEKQHKKHPRKGAKTAQELVRLLEHETD